MSLLKWEDEGTGTDKGRDQNADSHAHGTSRDISAWWQIGPDRDDTWSVSLTFRDDKFYEVDHLRLPNQPSEQAAKDAAEQYEREHRGDIIQEEPI